MSAGDEGFFQPAEWALHAATWLAWPSRFDLWGDNLAAAREAFVAFCEALSEGEPLDVLVPDAANEPAATQALAHVNASIHRVPFGDIWLRDTAPVYLKGPRHQRATVRFRFNGWGGKYVLEHDDEVAERLQALTKLPAFVSKAVLEGGSVDVDGEGTVLTTRQCLLNANRNPGWSEGELERELRATLGAEKVIWLGDGLANDHTDGHVDNVARFVAPGRVVCMEPMASDDPNREALEAIAKALGEARDARGRKLDVVRIPSPGRVLGEVADGERHVVPASFVNFFIGNAAVVVPVYETPWDDLAVARIAELFPGRRTVGVRANAILSGGGAFHCISQQQPA